MNIVAMPSEEILLPRNVDESSEEQYPCERNNAVQCEATPRFDIAKSLSGVFRGIAEGADNDLHIAARRGDHETINRLLEGKLKRKPIPSGIIRSSMTCKFGKPTQYIDESSPDRREAAMKGLNIRNHIGATPLWLAAAAGHNEAAEALCKHGADLEVENIKGQTPLFAAAKFNNVKCVKALLESGANPDGSSRNISTPIFIASRENFPQVVSLLIKHGADVNGRFGEKVSSVVKSSNVSTFIGSVPVYMTIVYQNFECFRQLVTSGAKLNASANDRGFGTSLVAAVLRHHCDVRYLELIALCGGIRHGDRQGIEDAVMLFRQYTHGLASSRKECLEFLDNWNATPLRLSQICRLSIHRHLGQMKLRVTDQLQLPARLRNYIMMEHVYPISDYFTDTKAM